MSDSGTLEARFWSKVQKGDGCWLWVAGKNGHGYAQFSAWGRPHIASRISWFLTHGDIPKGMYICHKCDNRLCVRPDHLFLGTPTENNLDKSIKGRACGPIGFLPRRARKAKRGPEPRPLAERFWAKVKKTGDCWMWTGAVERDGRGTMAIDSTGRHCNAPRVSWMINKGPIPEGMWVLHRCDNPRCVNPEHLFLGTASDNNLDSLRKGRRTMPPVVGEKNPRAKLSAEDVAVIRKSDLAAKVLAERYGVSRGAIYHIRSGYTWGPTYAA